MQPTGSYNERYEWTPRPRCLSDLETHPRALIPPAEPLSHYLIPLPPPAERSPGTCVSPSYMAPEQRGPSGPAVCSPEADIWAAAAVICHAFSGRTPFVEFRDKVSCRDMRRRSRTREFFPRVECTRQDPDEVPSCCIGTAME